MNNNESNIENESLRRDRVRISARRNDLCSRRHREMALFVAFRAGKSSRRGENEELNLPSTNIEFDNSFSQSPSRARDRLSHSPIHRIARLPSQSGEIPPKVSRNLPNGNIPLARHTSVPPLRAAYATLRSTNGGTTRGKSVAKRI